MEKKKSRYSLDDIKRLVGKDCWAITLTAQRKALQDFGLNTDGIKNVIMGLTNHDFYKSMTTLADSTLWQDVYRPWIGDKQAYVKVQIANEATVVIQFKEK